MHKKSFTLMELMVVVIIIGILATVGLPTYRNFIEDQRATVCQTNLRALKTALDIYVMEHDRIPAGLSKLPFEYIQRAYAQVLQEKGAWKIKLAYFMADREDRGMAYATGNELSLRNDLAKGDIKLITCPSDSTPPAAGGRSYGLYSVLANMTSQQYRDLSSNTLLIADCETDTFSTTSQLTRRHKYNNYPCTLGIKKDGIVSRYYN